MMNSCAIIRINVGGKIFETTKETLLLSGSSSKFHQILQEIPSTDHNQNLDKKTEIFFDRDPESFEHILFYLRTASLAGVRDLVALEKLKVEAEFYGLGQGFQDILRGKERVLNLTVKEVNQLPMKKDVDLRKTYVIKMQILLKNVDDYVKWDIERNENIIKIAIGHRTQCSTQMRYQVTHGDTYNLQMTLNITTRVNETNRERLEKHTVKSIQSQFNATINVLSIDEVTHCAYCERLLPNLKHDVNVSITPTSCNSSSISANGSFIPPSPMHQKSKKQQTPTHKLPATAVNGN